MTIELPALHLTVRSGTGAESPGTPVEGATVKVVDTKCTPEKPLLRTFTTNAEGALPDPGLPYSTYDVCVSDGVRHISSSGVAVPSDPEDLEAGAELEVFYLGDPEAPAGACP